MAHDWLHDHLVSTYGIDIAALDPLDEAVWRVTTVEGPSWVARAFAGSAAAGVQGQVELLRALQAGRFPAERCASDEPVSWHGRTAVLVTEWIDGRPSDGRGRTYAYLGGLLGALHAHEGSNLRPGGAWHHLSPIGGPRAEIDAALALMEQAPGRGREDVIAALRGLDDCADAPHALVHPDAVPPNMITTPDDKRVIVDWAGAGRGPRLWSLAFALWAAGVHSPKLVDVMITRYFRHIELTDDELTRLPGVIGARPLTMDVWAVAHRGLPVERVLERWRANRDVVERIAGQVRARAAS
jgi:Ser/Thr protein kinase RdoA (MazF antagonist)